MSGRNIGVMGSGDNGVRYHLKIHWGKWGKWCQENGVSEGKWCQVPFKNSLKENGGKMGGKKV